MCVCVYVYNKCVCMSARVYSIYIYIYIAHITLTLCVPLRSDQQTFSDNSFPIILALCCHLFDNPLRITSNDENTTFPRRFFYFCFFFPFQEGVFICLIYAIIVSIVSHITIRYIENIGWPQGGHPSVKI